MNDEYTPTTERVREEWPGRPESFDRWLVEHDRAVAEKAWQQGWDQGFRDYRAAPFEHGYVVVTPTDNPYTVRESVSTQSEETP